MDCEMVIIEELMTFRILLAHMVNVDSAEHNIVNGKTSYIKSTMLHYKEHAPKEYKFCSKNQA
jgi:hypothetical protein